MAKQWENFEVECFNHLVEKYNGIARFKHHGGSNAKISDIEVNTKSSNFFIEVKGNKAQSGQFVLIPDVNTNQFSFSSKNDSKENDWTNAIIKDMNTKFDFYNKAGTSGKIIEISPDISFSWVKNHYKSKNVLFFMSKNTSYIFVPIDNIDKYFNITAKYRVKKSGSSSPSRTAYLQIKELLELKYPNSTVSLIGKKVFFTSTDTSLNTHKFTIDTYTYQLSLKDSDGYYEIRRLSNTANSNVIFSVELKAKQNLDDLELFEDMLSK